MNLTLDALSSLLRGLNMLSLAVVAAPEGDPGEAVGFRVPRDLFSLVPTRLFDSTAEEDGLVREKNVINFFWERYTALLLCDVYYVAEKLSCRKLNYGRGSTTEQTFTHFLHAQNFKHS